MGASNPEALGEFGKLLADAGKRLHPKALWLSRDSPKSCRFHHTSGSTHGLQAHKRKPILWGLENIDYLEPKGNRNVQQRIKNG